MSLVGKVAIVTGASRGIGVRIAQVLAMAGASVVITARPSADGGNTTLERVADDICRDGARALAVQCDSASEEDVRTLTRIAKENFGRVDVLVNNAATRLSTRLLDTAPSEFERIFRVNVLGPFLLWRHVIPEMIVSGGGNIINLTSTNARQQPFFGMAPYRMTKVALTYLSVDLALEVASDGIAVNAFDPGPIVSEGTAIARIERQQRYNTTIDYHQQDAVEVLDEPIRWLADQTVDTFTGQSVRRTDYGRSWGAGVASHPDKGGP